MRAKRTSRSAEFAFEEVTRLRYTDPAFVRAFRRLRGDRPRSHEARWLRRLLAVARSRRRTLGLRDIQPLYWQVLLQEMNQIVRQRNDFVEYARTYGTDDLRQMIEKVKRSLRLEGSEYQPSNDRLVEQAIAIVEREEAHAKETARWQEAMIKAEAAEERYKVLEEQRRWRDEYEQASQLDKLRQSARDLHPGLRLMNPEHRKVFLAPDSYLYERMDAALGPAAGQIPVAGTVIDGVKAASMAKAKLVDEDPNVTWTDVGVATLSAVPGIGLVGTVIDIVREDRRNYQKSKELLEFWEEQRRQEELKRAQPTTPRD